MNLESLIEVLNETQIDVIDSVTNTYPGAKEMFMADDTMDVPFVRYDYLDIEKVKHNIERLENTSVDNSELEEWQYVLFDDLMRYNIEKNKFVYLNYKYSFSDEECKAFIEKDFYKYNEILFGAPDKEDFLNILSHELHELDKRQYNKEEKVMLDELMALLPEIPDDSFDIFIPSENILKKLHERTVSYYSCFLKHIPDKDRFELDEICKITDKIIEDVYADKKGVWRVIYDQDRSFASVSQYKREIRFPGKRNVPYYTKESLTELIIHEIGVHFLRELPFDKIEYEPVRTGLRGYEIIEEGIALSLSQSVINSFKFPGFIHYVTIGLAYFYKLSFREVYEIQKRLQYLAYNLPFGRSYDSVNRAFRGTYKLVNFKDLAYYNGATKIWKYISEHIDDPLLFDKLLRSGKTDIFNTDQQKIIREIKALYRIE